MPTVLIVEDEGPVLLLAEWVLQSAGYETVSANTVADALTVIDNPHQQLDLLFTDLCLKDDMEGGLDVGQAARQARPSMTVVYTTGRKVTNGLVKRFVEPNRFIAKPYTNKHLLAAVADLLNNKGA
jgi:DNA-binding NtrC family response regulator